MSYNRNGYRIGGGGGGGGGQICRFFQQGRCKYGNDCKFEHPGSQSNQQSNRFAALDNTQRSSGFGTDRYRPSSQTPAYGLTKDGIRADLTVGGDSGEKPIWPLSAYGPGRDAPRQLIEGDCEQSPEEVRLQYYIARATGNPADLEKYEQIERAAAENASQQAQKILNDIDGALRFINDGENAHPNRIDQVVKPTTPWQAPASNAGNSGFGQPSAPAFGGAQNTGNAANPSPFGVANQQQQQQPAFGQPAFGAPSNPGGGPSPFSNALGQTASSTPAFGAPSAFGKPSQPTSTFGAPSSFGAAANKPSPFAAAAQNQSQTPAFGAPSFGAPSNLGAAQNNNPSPFGGASQQPPANSPFGGASQQPSGNSPFGAVSNQTPQSNPFGAGNNSAQPAGNNPFGAPSAPQTQSPFGAPSQPSSNPFGGQQKSNPFAQTASPQPTNGFGAPSQPTGGFGNPSQQTNGFGSGAQNTGGFGSVSQQNNTSSGATTRGANGTLQSWKGQAVQYITPEGATESYPVFRNPNTNKLERIWHPAGPPATQDLDAEGEPQAYEGDVGAILKQAYDFVRENGDFNDGIMPEIPPKREWVSYEV